MFNKKTTPKKLTPTERGRKMVGDIILQQRVSITDAKRIAKEKVQFYLEQLDLEMQGWLTPDIERYWGFVMYAIDQINETEEWRLY